MTSPSPWVKDNRILLMTAMLPAALFILVLFGLAAWVVTYSFTNIELVGLKSINWEWVGFRNYEKLLTQRGFLDSLWITVTFCFFSAIIGQSVIGFTLASTMRGVKSPVRTVVEVSLMLGWLLPDVVAAFLWSATTNKSGMINMLFFVPLGLHPVDFINDYALAVVIVANVWKGSAWSYLLYSAALDAVSREVIESARVEGASTLQIVMRVVLPMIKPQIATNMLFITIWTFSYFALIYAMTGGGPGGQTQVLSVFLYRQSFEIGKLGYGAAISVAMLLIVGVASIFYLRLMKERE